MDVPREGSIRRMRCRLALAALAPAAVALAEPANSLPPPAIAAISIPFFVDQKLGDGIRGSLEEAARRLSGARCQALLADFTDGSGHTLDDNLRAIGQSLPDYLAFVLFYDGSTTDACKSERILAWTSPGSRAVHVCASQFSYWQRVNPGYTATIVIHETLHTLGLGERPPTSGEITAKVIERCGN